MNKLLLRSTRKRSWQALTLMEVMVAIGLLAVASLSLLIVFVQGLKLMQRSNEMAAGNDVAEAVLESVKRDFRNTGFTAIPSGTYVFDGRVPDAAIVSGPTTFPPIPYPDTRVNDTDYKIVVEGREEGNRIRRVKVSVYWNKEQPLVLETLVHP